MLGQTPWVRNVSQRGGTYFVRDPLPPAICSTWYRVNLSLKSESDLKRLTTFSVVMPMFIKNDVKAKRPMWETLRPDVIVPCNSLMHGGNALITTSLEGPSGRASPRFSLSCCVNRFTRFISVSGSGPTSVSSFPSMYLRISSSKRRATSVFVRQTFPFDIRLLTSFHFLS